MSILTPQVTESLLTRAAALGLSLVQTAAETIGSVLPEGVLGTALLATGVLGVPAIVALRRRLKQSSTVAVAPALVAVAPKAPKRAYSSTNANLIPGDFAQTRAGIISVRGARSSRIEVYITIPNCTIPGRGLTKTVLKDIVGGLTAQQQLDNIRQTRTNRSLDNIKESIADIIMPGVRGKTAPSMTNLSAYQAHQKEQAEYKKLLDEIVEGTCVIACSDTGIDQKTTFHNLAFHKGVGKPYFSGADRLPADPRSKDYTDDDLNSSTAHGTAIYNAVAAELKEKFEALIALENQINDLKYERSLLNPRLAADVIKAGALTAEIASLTAPNSEQVLLVEKIKDLNSMLENLKRTVIDPLREIHYIRGDGQPNTELEDLSSPATIYNEFLPKTPEFDSPSDDSLPTKDKSERILTLGQHYNELALFFRSPAGRLLPTLHKKALQLKCIQEIKKVMNAITEETLKDTIDGGDHIVRKVKEAYQINPAFGKTNFDIAKEDYIERDVLPDALFMLSRGKRSHFLDPKGWFLGPDVAKDDFIPSAKFADVKDHPIFLLLSDEEKAYIENDVYGKDVEEAKKHYRELMEKSKTPPTYKVIKNAFEEFGERAEIFFRDVANRIMFTNGRPYQLKRGADNIFHNIGRPDPTRHSAKRFGFRGFSVVDVDGRGVRNSPTGPQRQRVVL